MFFDPTYFLFLGPAILLSLWASFKTRSAFNKYSKVATMGGMTGAQAAQLLLKRGPLEQQCGLPFLGGGHDDHCGRRAKKDGMGELGKWTNCLNQNGYGFYVFMVCQVGY